MSQNPKDNAALDGRYVGIEHPLVVFKLLEPLLERLESGVSLIMIAHATHSISTCGSQ
jgi:hypothetical protein